MGWTEAPVTCVAYMQPGLHLSLEKLEWGLSQKLLPVYGICSSSWAALSGLSGRGSTKPLRELKCKCEGNTQGILSHSEEKGPCYGENIVGCVAMSWM